MTSTNTRSLLSSVLILGAGFGVYVGACSGTDEASLTWTGSALAPESTSTALVLDRMEATYTFPSSNLPEGASSGVFLLTDLRATKTATGTTYTTPLPFLVPKGQRRFAPKGMRVFVGEEEIFFHASGPAPAGPYWSFEKDTLRFGYSEGVEALRIEHPAAAAGFKRLNHGTAAQAGMSDEDFAHYGVPMGQRHREGLLLPSPTTATWSAITLPTGANFVTHLAMAPSLLRSQSDGASVVLEIVSDGEPVEVARTQVPGTSSAFEEWSVSLEKWQGKTVDLILRTEAGETSNYDFVFAGSPQVHGEAGAARRRVLVIGVDTLRPDHLSVNGYSRNTTPELDEWVQDAVRFDRAWTSAPRTRPSFRAATTGRLPLDAVCAKNIGEVFDEAGFATAGIVANIHLNPQFDFQKGFDLWWLDGKAKVVDQVARAKDFLEENADRDVYMFLHIMDPHIFYRAPEPWGSRFTSELPPLPKDQSIPKMFNRWQVYKWMRQGKLTDERKQWMKALYDGEVAYTSYGLGDLLAYFEALPGDNVVVIHSDHGEELWDHGGFEHNHTLYDDTTRAVMWVKPPGGTGHKGMRNAYPATLQDIAPTLYELAGITEVPKTDGESLVPAMRGEVNGAASDRPIPIGHLRYDADRWGVVYNDHKYVLVTGSGEEELYDLQADPDEMNNLAAGTDTEPYWRKMGESHRVDVGHGWRIDVSLKKGTTTTLQLPVAALSADVIDPELITRHPVNQVWGEVPKVSPSDVATMTLAADGKTLTIVGGPKGQGTLYVRFADATPVDGLVATAPSGDVDINPDGVLAVGGATFDVTAGVVLVVPEGEASRMKACVTGDASDDEMEMLKAMGYVGEHDAPR